MYYRNFNKNYSYNFFTIFSCFSKQFKFYMYLTYTLIIIIVLLIICKLTPKFILLFYIKINSTKIKNTLRELRDSNVIHFKKFLKSIFQKTCIHNITTCQGYQLLLNNLYKENSYLTFFCCRKQNT